MRKAKNKGGRPPALKMPDAIPATPEGLARSIMQSPAKKDSEWRFLKPGGEGYEGGLRGWSEAYEEVSETCSGRRIAMNVSVEFLDAVNDDGKRPTASGERRRLPS